jgi:hypothetical protein
MSYDNRLLVNSILYEHTSLNHATAKQYTDAFLSGKLRNREILSIIKRNLPRELQELADHNGIAAILPKFVSSNLPLLVNLCLFVPIVTAFFSLLLYGQSQYSINSDVSGLTIFLIALSIMFVIGLLEATQVAILALNNKELDSLKDSYPIANKARAFLQDDRFLANYLIGRQCLVVVLVTTFSQVTLLKSVPSLPLYPSFVPESVSFLIFNLGVFNAFIVLWLAQLFPQLLAAASPVQMLNYRSAYVVYNLAYFLGKALFISRTSTRTLINLVNPPKVNVPLSDGEQFEFSSVNNDYLTESRELSVCDDGERTSKVSFKESHILTNDQPGISLQSPELTNASSVFDYKSSFSLIRENKEGHELDVRCLDDAYQQDQYGLFPVTGNHFLSGDKLQLQGEFSWEPTTDERCMRVQFDKPCKYFMGNVAVSKKLLGNTMKGNLSARLTLELRTNSGTADAGALITEKTIPFREEDNCASAVFSHCYVPANSVLLIRWLDS